MTTLYDNPLSALLEMIERCAPKLMKTGGGPLIQDSGRIRATLTPERRQQILDSILKGYLTRDIAAQHGVSRATVCSIRRANGIAPQR